MADEYTYYCNEDAAKLTVTIDTGSDNTPKVVVNARRVYLNIQQVEELRDELNDLLFKCRAETDEQS